MPSHFTLTKFLLLPAAMFYFSDPKCDLQLFMSACLFFALLVLTSLMQTAGTSNSKTIFVKLSLHPRLNRMEQSTETGCVFINQCARSSMSFDSCFGCPEETIYFKFKGFHNFVLHKKNFRFAGSAFFSVV